MAWTDKPAMIRTLMQHHDYTYYGAAFLVEFEPELAAKLCQQVERTQIEAEKARYRPGERKLEEEGRNG